MSLKRGMITLKKAHLALLIGAAFLAALLFALFFLSLSADGTILKGAVAAGVDIGGKTRDEAVALLKDAALDGNAQASIAVDIYTITFEAGDIGAHYDAEKTVDAIMGESQGFFAKIASNFKKTKYPMVVELDENLLDSAIKNKLYGIEREVTDISYEITDGGIQVTNGTSGMMLDRQKAKEAVCAQFGSVDANAETPKLEIEKTYPAAVDTDAFLSQFTSDAKDAVYVRNTDGTIAVEEESVGITVDRNAAAKVMEEHKAEGETYSLPAEVILPKHTKAELEACLFADTLAQYSSNFASSAQNRVDNINLAAQSINSVVLMPGESFSFNGSVGERTKARGYKEAHAYAAGEVVDQVGGGICQVSSTLYNAVLLSNLQIVERRCHQMTVAYVPLGRDATVDWGTQDFRFSNNTDYPIRIEAGTSGKNLNIAIIGTKTDKSLKVDIQTQTLSTIEPPVKEQEDPTLPKGERKVVKQGSRGYVVDAYRVVYSNGQEVSREKLRQSTYNPTATTVKVGTMEVAAPAESETAA